MGSLKKFRNTFRTPCISVMPQAAVSRTSELSTSTAAGFHPRMKQKIENYLAQKLAAIR